MSGVTYKHSLRRHVPSGSHRRSETPSPPSTPTKPPSSPSSTQPHHSKRERVKEAVEHFFDKFHHHHHHHHHHGDEHGSQGKALSVRCSGPSVLTTCTRRSADSFPAREGWG
ncbi:hypothetical protein BDW22DRAFT_1360800 [Trametopsis cervina]|nr:hypothetical protein BDW22DRAFT_1360800 [Trametopsis cervina]